MADEITGTEKILDSRDVIARIEELEAERATLAEAVEEAEEALADAEGDEGESYQDDLETAQSALEEWDAGEEAAELKELQSLADDLSGYGDWSHGDTIIREDHFQEYAEELAEDCCGMSKKLVGRWPYCHIDWEAAADALKADYTEGTAFGHNWLMRA